ncbi:hypothetical protein JC606_20155 [Vibrio sp. IB15]|uniref:hypothetical protein n=1 Tax=Vibrio sp. IB15 TaxID=2779368 RepID=UPI0018E82758|nr:hypothetical protein [Vibrio sp. IB15]MBJ2148661.1 hypothetical protein [Vibrio sp. IB15]
MKLDWELSQSSIVKWKMFYEQNKNSSFVQNRYRRNVARTEALDLDENAIWNAFIMCQLTTAQRSGPTSRVSKFLKGSSPMLDYGTCTNAIDPEKFFYDELTNAGVRRTNIISENLADTLYWFNQQHMEEVKALVEQTYSQGTRESEIELAEALSEYKGIGLKQSRNLGQYLGVTKYEIPIDSRVIKKLDEFGCGFSPSAHALTCPQVYRVVHNLIDQISAELGIVPCILDACIFSSFDT